MSAITLQAMADVGYVVDTTLADDYQLPRGDREGDDPGVGRGPGKWVRR